LARVTATPRFLWPRTVLVEVYGGWSTAGWDRWLRVSSTRRRLRQIPLLPLLPAAFFGFFLLYVVYSCCFLRYSLSVYCSNFIEISVD